jgi:hypothetical protein
MENQQEMQMSPEEIAARREEMLEFYKSSMVYLTSQYEYEEMLLKLDETRFKRTQIQMQYAIMANQAEHVDEDEELEKSTDSNINKKSLKKQ